MKGAEERFRYLALLFCGAMVLVYVAQLSFSGMTEEFLLTAAALEKPWLLITSVFLHGSLLHLLSNIFALGFFGSILEKVAGAKKFAIIFFGTAVIASAASAFFYDASLGASGAVFGVLGALAALRPRMIVWTYGVPMPMFVAAIFWFVLDLAGVFFPSSIANAAHIAGLAVGVAIGIFLRTAGTYKDEKRKEEKLVSENKLDEWEEEWM